MVSSQVFSDPQEHESTAGPPSEQMIRDRILFTLSHYPMITMSMLTVGIGPAVIPSREWRPVLDRMLEEGLVKKINTQVKTIGGRYLTIQRLVLPTNMDIADEIIQRSAAAESVRVQQ